MFAFGYKYTGCLLIDTYIEGTRAIGRSITHWEALNAQEAEVQLWRGIALGKKKKIILKGNNPWLILKEKIYVDMGPQPSS